MFREGLSPKLETETIPEKIDRGELLTLRERRLLGELTPEQSELIQKWNSNNLTKNRKAIVGIRSEDLPFLLESARLGYMPTQGSPLMGKSDESHFYITPNPESMFLTAKMPDVLSVCDKKSFREMTEYNLKLYRAIAIKQAIFRNIISELEPNEHEMLRQEVASMEEYKDGIPDLEDFYQDLAAEVSNNPNVLDFRSRTRPTLHTFSKYVARVYSPADANTFLRSLHLRGGITLAFNEKLFERYGYVGSGDGPGNEAVLSVPGGRLELDIIEGFESLGEFEDTMLDKLELSK